MSKSRTRLTLAIAPAGQPIIPGRAEWLRGEMLKTRVAHGYCSRQLAAEACPYANICEQRANYVTAPEFIPQLQASSPTSPRSATWPTTNTALIEPAQAVRDLPVAFRAWRAGDPDDDCKNTATSVTVALARAVFPHATRSAGAPSWRPENGGTSRAGRTGRVLIAAAVAEGRRPPYRSKRSWIQDFRPSRGTNRPSSIDAYALQSMII